MSSSATHANAIDGVTTLPALVPRRDRCFPVDEALATMLPDAGLMRGRLIGCSGPAAWSLALALVARAVGTGSWLAIVGAPAVGLEAADELGVSLARVVLVDVDGGASVWAERVAAAADGFELIVTSPPAGAERVVRRVRQRVQARGVVMVAVGATSPNVSCDLEFTTTSVAWEGIGQGSGHLTGRRADVRLAGRRIPLPIERRLLLPGGTGRIESLAEHAERSAAAVLEQAV